MLCGVWLCRCARVVCPRMWCAVRMLIVVACWLFFFFGILIYKHVVCNLFFFFSFFPFFFYLYLFIGLLSFQSQGECAVNRPDEHPSRQQRLVPGLP